MSTLSYSMPTRSSTSRARSHRWQPWAWKKTTVAAALGVKATCHGGCGIVLNGKAVRREAHRRRSLDPRGPRLLECARDDLVQPRVDLVLFPEVLLEPLHPLEVGDDDTACVREHVGEDEHTVRLEDVVGGRRDGAVRALDEDARLHRVCVDLGHDLLERARREHVAVDGDELVVRDRLAPTQLADRPAVALVRERGGDI